MGEYTFTVEDGRVIARRAEPLPAGPDTRVFLTAEQVAELEEFDARAHQKMMEAAADAHITKRVADLISELTEAEGA